MDVTDDELRQLVNDGYSDDEIASLYEDSPTQIAVSSTPDLPDTTGSFLGDALDTLGGTAKGAVSGLGGTLAGGLDFLGTGLASGIQSVINMEPTWLGGDGVLAPAFDEGLDILTGDIGENSATGRIGTRGGELLGNAAGFLIPGAQAARGAGLLGKVGRFLSAGPKQQLLLSALGGSAGQGAVEAGLVDQGGLGQTGVELGTMVAPGVAGGLYNLGKAGLRKLYQGADEASGEVFNTIKGALDDPTVLTRPSGTSSAQALREERLGELAKLARTEAGQGVGAARETVEQLSPEVADNMAYLSRLLKEKKFPSAGTNLQQVSDEIARVQTALSEVPETLVRESPFPLVNEKYGDIIKGIGRSETANPVKGAVEELLASKAEFSDLAKELQTVFKTSRNIGEEAYIDAASKVGARLKQPQAAKAFVELTDGNPEMLSIGKSSLLQNVFSGTPTSWAKNINKTRGSLQEMFTPAQIKGLEAVATKNANLVGGLMVSQPVRLLGNKLVYAGLIGGGALGGIPGLAAGAAIGKVSKVIAEKPQIMQELISKAFQSGEFASLLSQKATPQNIKAALESFKLAGRNAIMGIAADDEPNTKPNKLADQSLPSNDSKKKEEIIPEKISFEDRELTPKIAPDLVKKVIATESSFNPKAIGPMTKYGTAKGLMQLLDSTGKEWHDKLGLPGEYDPFNAEQNQKIGTAYLGWLSDQFNGDEKLALAAYNWGIGNLKNLLKKNKGATFDELKYSLPKETRDYVNKITKA